MRAYLLPLIVALVVLTDPLLAQPFAATENVRFEAVDVLIDSHGVPLAAWQFELTERSAAMRVVGVEGGEHPAYATAPYFDRDAVARGRADRIIVAAYSLRDDVDLPTGATRVATVHVQLTGSLRPDYQLIQIVAGDSSGRAIPADITLRPSTERP
ncbi:MAG: hypothetical protein AAF184_19030 [Pseudomonadota bacterium]